MELKDKTLKELGLYLMGFDKRVGKAIFREDLIQWAIAKIKACCIDKWSDLYIKKGNKFVRLKAPMCSVCKTRMKDFNLTEKDLDG